MLGIVDKNARERFSELDEATDPEEAPGQVR
jgi:hypothetical protein